MSPSSVSNLPLARVAGELTRVRQNAPLVHVLTNEVVQEITANVLLALGASPAMIVAEQEIASFVGMAGAVLINVGTLYPERHEAMRRAAVAALATDTPWTLDPVAVGVLDYRTAACRALLNQRPAAIRGNASEILSLAGAAAAGKGVESTAEATDAVDAAAQLARTTGAVVAVTGATDYVTDGERTWALPWGHPLMTRVVGTGCALSAVVAAFTAGAEDRLVAVAAACAVMGLAGERAVAACRGPGSFVPAFLDELYWLEPEKQGSEAV